VWLRGTITPLLMPSALALVTGLFPEGPQRARALGVFSGMGGVAAAAGVLLGGLLASVGRPWVFLLNVPVGLAVVIAGPRILPADRPRPSGRLDLAGALTGTATALTYSPYRCPDGARKMILLSVESGGAGPLRCR
jgi:MFS family permease